MAGENLPVRPAGRPLAASATGELKPFVNSEMVILETEALAPCCNEALAALLVSLKFGGPVTVTDIIAVFAMLGAAPVTTTWYTPGVTKVFAETENTELDPDPDKVATENLPVRPAGKPLADNATGELKPFVKPDIAIFATVALAPCCNKALAALLFRLKLGDPVTVADTIAVFAIVPAVPVMAI